MRCPKCNTENKEGRKFCSKCGIKLENICPKCGYKNDTEDAFCGECGTQIVVAIQDKEITGEPSPDAERRQVTVMFCDLVGSTPLSERLDPEELREVIHDYQSACARVIRRFDGHIARYLGDGLLVYFGYPASHEDDAQRAVRSGLGILEAMNRLNMRLQQKLMVNLQIRLGIHTGIVVAGDIDENEQLESDAIVGDTPNIAARLQKLAKPDTLVISSTTYHLIEGYFDCQSLGAYSLEGISAPMEVYHVIHESGARTRLDTTRPTEFTPLVGREQELGLLMDRWEQVKEKMGHVVLLNGEAGIGKSRIVRVLEERVAEDPQAWLVECHCSPYHQNTAFYPVVDLFERVILQFERDDTPQDKLSKVEGFLVQYGLPLEGTVPLFSTLLSIPLNNSYSPLNLTPQQQKIKTLQMLLGILLKRASQQPVLFVVEDLHWADASSLEFLDLLIDQVPTVPIFTLLSFRPTFTPHWTGRSYLSSITLNRLTRRQVTDMVEHIAGKPLPVQVTEQLVAKTDGVPLFVEELTKMVLESGLLKEQDDSYELVGPLPPLAIPTTLQDSLMARLDRLATVKEVAQLGAVIGREFTYELLRTVSTLDEETLQKALSQLVDSELLYQRGLPPQSTYIFKHILICDTAYDSLLKSRRQQYHQRIAQALENTDTAETQPQIVAHHYTEAGLNEQAIPYWHQAGQQAVKRSANVEAVNHLTLGINLLKDLPETPEHIQQELKLHVTLGPALIATKGYGIPEVEAVFSQSLSLCEKLGDLPQLLPTLWGLFAFYLFSSEFQTVRKIADRISSIAQSTKDPLHVMQSHLVWCNIFYHTGDFVPSLDHSKKGFAIYDIEQHRHLTFVYGRSPGVHCLYYMASALWMLGYPDKALEKVDESFKMAQELDHPFTQAMALNYYSYIHQIRQEVNAAQERSEQQIALCSEQNFPVWLAIGTILHGWTIGKQGRIEEGIMRMQQGLTTWKSTGSKIGVPHLYSLLAEILIQAGRIQDGLTTLEKALAILNETGDCYYESELHRLKGELMLTQGDNNKAEDCFNKAIHISQHQQAKSWELRSTVSLCRLWQKQGKREESRKILQEIYNWFTEGFDTKDLQEAKALLEELS